MVEKRAREWHRTQVLRGKCGGEISNVKAGRQSILRTEAGWDLRYIILAAGAAALLALF